MFFGILFFRVRAYCSMAIRKVLAIGNVFGKAIRVGKTKAARTGGAAAICLCAKTEFSHRPGLGMRTGHDYLRAHLEHFPAPASRRDVIRKKPMNQVLWLNKYPFDVANHGANWNDVGGVYIFTG